MPPGLSPGSPTQAHIDEARLQEAYSLVSSWVAEGNASGAVVAVARGSFFRRGDIVIELNGKPVATAAELALAAELAIRQRWISAIVHRDGNKARIVQRW